MCLHAVADMVFRNNENNEARLVTVPQVGNGLNVVEATTVTIPSA